MKKDITVTIDSSSFPKSQVQYYNPLLTVNKIDVNCMLIHTALWTRPPKLTGFHLSDFWAWLRYFPAFSKTSSDLRLRKEWKDIDPHQKTILSDEIGVGSTTYTLINTLSFQGFIDAIYVLETLNLTHLLLKKSKNGKGKTPDYIGLDNFGRVIALECKGTQNKIKDLYKAITKGIEQKENLTKNPTGPIKTGLVGGIFIPQFDNPESALIHFRDPDWNEFNEIISEVAPEELAKAIIRGAVIKQLYLAGANNSANELSNYIKGNDFELSAQATQELKSFEREIIVFSHNFRNPVEGGVSNIKFSAQIDNKILPLIEGLTSNSAKASVLINELSVTKKNFDRRHNDRSWISFENDYSGMIVSPHGFKFKLNYKMND
ncbi:TPA: hypothetical protein SML19_001581 [Klebsiella oxytoca]|uniref:hypothetical protein n=1 Tax=Citrobacter TaxID=544 RepID=UPI00190339CD|nr:hypothetical protein [Citrobacter koseri]MBJ9345955.1 hypothetical protein [Citrobacter koseri]HEJ8280363.1 hypothetical protein [Klebsiella oxytoca]HEJ8975066.1 hypothetical protein [Klebsiella oxytoca]